MAEEKEAGMGAECQSLGRHWEPESDPESESDPEPDPEPEAGPGPGPLPPVNSHSIAQSCK